MKTRDRKQNITNSVHTNSYDVHIKSETLHILLNVFIKVIHVKKTNKRNL
jgi:hypothetical protein